MVANTFPLIAGARAGTTTWWDQYINGLNGQYGNAVRISPASQSELLRATNDIHSAVPDLTDVAAWGAKNYRITGAVVGGIQAGKTRSMIGLAARAFDRGFRIVIVLSGVKNDLREQTSRRFHVDLLQTGEPLYQDSTLIGYTHPLGAGPHGDRRDFWAMASETDAIDAGPIVNYILNALGKNEYVLLVVKKQKDNLIATTGALNATWAAQAAQGGPPPPLLVLDDECDEASVPGSARARIPQLISNLWGQAAVTQPVVYMGYTATPHSNILQDPNNVLYAKDFTKVIRAPGDQDTSLTFIEGGNPSRWYTGSEFFFRWLDSVGVPNFLFRTRLTQPEVLQQVPWRTSELSEAIISHFVSGAIRLITSGAALGAPPFDAAPHSMLVHTAGEKTAHTSLVAAVREICNGGPVAGSHQNVPPQQRLNRVGLAAWLNTDSARWRAWYDEFQTSFNQLQTLYAGGLRSFAFPSWQQVCATLPLIFANVKLKVINSDKVDDPLNFAPVTDISGAPANPEDVYTIVVGGNVLSRGLTIEGLCTTYFARWPNVAVDDTTMQRQRWLGYRGPHIEFCRVFTDQAICDALRRISDADLYMRDQIAAFAGGGVASVRASFTFFRGADRPTNKLGGAVPDDITFSGLKPYVRYVQRERGPNGDANLARDNELAAVAFFNRVAAQGQPRMSATGQSQGYVERNVSALDVADFLQSFKYRAHNPPNESPLYSAFAEHERLLLLPSNTLCRACDGTRPAQEIMPGNFDPYLIAAYLRLWHYAYNQIVNGAVPNRMQDQSGAIWAPSPAPVFNWAFRFGGKAAALGSPFAPNKLTERTVSLAGELEATWGSRRTRDDEWFDYAAPLRAETLRLPGEPGLLMTQVIHRESAGLGPDNFDLPTFGLVIPLGGPALPTTRTR